MRRNFQKETSGITLIALVVTIVVLIILATISINAVMGDDGLIKRAEQASQHQANAEAADSEAMDELEQHLANVIAGNGDTSTNPDDANDSGEKPLVSTVTSTNHTGTSAEDTLGNPVYIPGGFKVAEDSGETVKEGIVIEDSSGNQFVWIPVSNINGSESNPIKIDETNSVVITLGRYTFADSSADVPGEATIVQKGSEWNKTESAIDETYKIVSSYDSSYYHYELATKLSGKNEVAKSLSTFIDSVEEYHGYYLARYEASYASGSNTADYKPASKVSTAKSFSSSTVGSLWNGATQADASTVCQNMYSGDSYVESDLVNSYAWDTAIVYIQTMGNENYANQIDGYGELENTGSTGDEVCKIFDMGANCYEWTTEYCASDYYNCTNRGGTSYSVTGYTAYRNIHAVANTDIDVGFRPILYCKTGA